MAKKTGKKNFNNDIMKTFTMGDIHGSHKGMVQALERCGFDYKKDKLVQLGDVCDGWPETPECIEELKKITNLVQIIGNHDYWTIAWLEFGAIHQMWDIQGGQATIDAYLKRKPELREPHLEFWRKGVYKYIDDENRIFVHGGFYRGIDIKVQLIENLMWDRSLATKAVSGRTSGFKVNEYKEVYLGHTTVNSFKGKDLVPNEPIIGGNVILMDTGGGWEGVVTIMDIDTKEFWSSDLCKELYPNDKGRHG